MAKSDKEKPADKKPTKSEGSSAVKFIIGCIILLLAVAGGMLLWGSWDHSSNTLDGDQKPEKRVVEESTGSTSTAIKQWGLINIAPASTPVANEPQKNVEKRHLQRGQWCRVIDTTNKKFVPDYDGPVRICTNITYGGGHYFEHNGTGPDIYVTNEAGQHLIGDDGKPIIVKSLGDNVYELQYMPLDRDKPLTLTLISL